MKPIVTIPNKVLTSRAKPITQFDKKLAILIAEMKDTLTKKTNPKGVGLAAPQVGVGVQLFMTRPTEKSEIRVFINPSITTISDEKTEGLSKQDNKLEGCLSIPNIWGTVKRATSLTLSYQDEKGDKHTETFTGFLATIIQHEIDHLNGILFTHRVIEQKGKLYEPTTDDEGKEILEEVKL